jgi:lipoyl(octanoyl) transferase
MTAPLQVRDLGRAAFEPVWVLQRELADRRARGEEPDTLLLVEHDPVYTLGRGADAGDVLVPEAQLLAAGASVVRTDRGGKVTYHGPGQLVAYPVRRLTPADGGASGYVRRLEETAILTLGDFGVQGGREPRHRGVWIGGDKIAAVGVRICRGITMHGVSLNVTVEASPYGAIVPCGLPDRGVTSLHRLVPGVSMAAVRDAFVRRFREVFGYDD